MVVVMMIFCMGVVITGAQFKHMSKRRYEEEQKFQKYFFGRSNSKQKWYYEHELDLNQFNNQYQCQETQEQPVLYKFTCKQNNNMN